MYSDGLVEDSAAAQAASKAARSPPRVAAPSALLPASRIPQGPPRASRAASQRSSERSASASKAGQDSSSTLRRRFLSRVAQVTTWSLWEASDLAAPSLPSGSGAGNRASGMPRAWARTDRRPGASLHRLPLRLWDLRGARRARVPSGGASIRAPGRTRRG